MAYNPRYIQYINLPQVPQDIINNLPKNIEEYDRREFGPRHNPSPSYRWTDHHNEKINEWGQKNICAEIYWAFQFMTADLHIHKDTGTQIKFIYLIETGGPNVLTKFWKDDQCTLLDSYKIKTHAWHMLKADVFHSVEGVQPNQVRWSITGRVFSNNI
jgi:hypothetical protein